MFSPIKGLLIKSVTMSHLKSLGTTENLYVKVEIKWSSKNGPDCYIRFLET